MSWRLSELEPAWNGFRVFTTFAGGGGSSMVGKREKNWGVKKKFREGQAEQVLDELFFHFTDLAARLRPKIVVAENVKGILEGKARPYADRVLAELDKAGYDAEVKKLDASRMGVPQARQRAIFIGCRRDLGLPPVNLDFEEPVIPASAVCLGLKGMKLVTAGNYRYISKRHPKMRFPWDADSKPAPTILATKQPDAALDFPGDGTAVGARSYTRDELCELQTFPADYDFCGQDPRYVVGMSVPPVMMQRIALRVAASILS